MGHKIFISYKYHDSSVYQKIEHHLFEQRQVGTLLTPRDYVDVLSEYLEEHSSHYCKAEEDNNDLSTLSDEQIWEILKDKIFDSTMTIVIISPKMKEIGQTDREQWIPWEIKYSLDNNKRHTSSGREVTSPTNAMLAIVLPDRDNSYNYYFENKQCCQTGCRLNKTNTLFYILRKNTFNLKKDTTEYKCAIGDNVHKGNMHSYITFIKWSDVNSKEKIEGAIKHAYQIQSMKEQYDICHEINE